MAIHVGRLWSLAIATCQDPGWTLDAFVWLASEIKWGTAWGTKFSSNLTITFGVPPFSHNVTTKQNTTIGWVLKMANVPTKNSGA
jgi:hypothetical protein